jgi:hypothetical protein
MTDQNRLNLPGMCTEVTGCIQRFSSESSVETVRGGSDCREVTSKEWIHAAQIEEEAFGTERKCLAHLATYLNRNSFYRFVSNTRKKQQPTDNLKYTSSVCTGKPSMEQGGVSNRNNLISIRLGAKNTTKCIDGPWRCRFL